MLFDETTLRKITQLTLAPTTMRAGLMKGDRRSTKRGSSIEFSDYRDYVKGDDLRRLDWNIYARLDRPFVKLFEEEEDLAVHILIDYSTSMFWGEGDQHKMLFTLRLAGAIGAMALSANDRCTIAALKNHTKAAQFGPVRGVQHLARLLPFLESLLTHPPNHPTGTDLNLSLKSFSQGARRPGLVFLLSDFFSPTGFQSGFNQLIGHGYEVTAMHVLHPDELDPPFAGDLSLVDSETGQVQEVSVDGMMRQEYQKRILNWQAQNRKYFQQHSAHYLPLNTAQPWDKVIFTDLRKSGIVK
jgi:uncharacterized protein (DUF58 family)